MSRARSVKFGQLPADAFQGVARGARHELLPSDGFVTVPEHEYVPEVCSPTVLDAFRLVAEALRAQYADRAQYPNSRLYPWYSIDQTPSTTLDFMLVWGESTDLPHPRRYKADDYFNRMEQIIAKRRHRALFRDTMDGQGLLGRLHTTEVQTELALVSRADRRGRYNIGYCEVPMVPGSSDLIDMAAESTQLTPLRFHQAIQFNAGNGGIYCHVYPDDETLDISRLRINPIQDIS